MSLGLVVEGSGEVEAAPVLIRRIAAWAAPGVDLDVLRPWRVKRQQIVKDGELERIVRVMGQRVGRTGSIVVLPDADDDCPATLGPSLLRRATASFPQGRTTVVLAKREFESWFLATSHSLRGQRTLDANVETPPNPEDIRGAKEWLADRMSSGYAATLDQAAFAAEMDLSVATQNSDSFFKLVREICAILRVTPPDRQSP
jgi:hypothetical protein